MLMRCRSLCMEDVWNFWEAFEERLGSGGEQLGSIWGAFGELLERVWEAFEEFLDSIWKGFEAFEEFLDSI